VHLKLDTGMTRLGLRPEELPRALELVERLKGRVVVEGVFQNFATAYDPEADQNDSQRGIFLEGLNAIRAAGHRPSMVHTDNSGATLARSGPTAPSFSLLSRKSLSSVVTHVRPGLALYARVPEVESAVGEKLRDVMSFVSVVDQVKTVPAGTKVGYAGTFVCGRTTTLAVVPAGYADGVRRHLAERGQVLIGGRRCQIAGRISMDLTEVDVTDLPSPPVRGDEAVLFGSQGGERLDVDEVADTAGTVAWEILCGIGPRVPRIILEEGRTVERLSKFP
jgi:alanine racemase